MNLSLNALIVIAQLCLSTGNTPKEVEVSVKCNRALISCMSKEVEHQRIRNEPVAFTNCYTTYELNK